MVKYGTVWQTLPVDWWGRIHKQRAGFHKAFVSWAAERMPYCETVLEIGGGSGVYPVEYPELFAGVKYTNIDISSPAVSAGMSSSNCEFICGDFMIHDFCGGFDMVFAHAVIDHVEHPEAFVQKVALLTKKFGLVDSYVGYKDGLSEHERYWSDTKGCYDGVLSPSKLRSALGVIMPDSEFSVHRGLGDWPEDLIIEISRSQKSA